MITYTNGSEDYLLSKHFGQCLRFLRQETALVYDTLPIWRRMCREYVGDPPFQLSNRRAAWYIFDIPSSLRKVR